MDKALRELFGFQKFAGNPQISNRIRETKTARTEAHAKIRLFLP